MAKRKPRMKVWALKIAGADMAAYELAMSVNEPHVRRGARCYSFDRTPYTVAICGDIFEQFTSIQLEPGQVGRVSLRSLKQVRLVEAKHGKSK